MIKRLVCNFLGHKLYQYVPGSWGRSYIQTQDCQRCGFDTKIHPYLKVPVKSLEEYRNAVKEGK